MPLYRQIFRLAVRDLCSCLPAGGPIDGRCECRLIFIEDLLETPHKDRGRWRGVRGGVSCRVGGRRCSGCVRRSGGFAGVRRNVRLWRRNAVLRRVWGDCTPSLGRGAFLPQTVSSFLENGFDPRRHCCGYGNRRGDPVCSDEGFTVFTIRTVGSFLRPEASCRARFRFGVFALRLHFASALRTNRVLPRHRNRSCGVPLFRRRLVSSGIVSGVRTARAATMRASENEP